MNAFFVFASVVAVASAGTAPLSIQKVGYGPSSIVRAPAHDSASIESHRLGGNFAYATAEAHAYAHITPEISEAVHPVAETTHVHQPAPIAHVKPAPIVHTHHAARPVFKHEPILAQEPVIGPIAARTHVEQPIIKQQHVTYAQPTVTVAHQPAVAVAAAPAAVEAVGYAAAPAAIAAAPAGPYGYAAGAPLIALAQEH